MFFYANFLRPPPLASGVSGSISITPQISNDLRTSYLDGATDMYYAWFPSLHDCTASNVASAARKLTTWRESSMYKSIAIPLPSNAKVGQEWRLALAASDADSNFVVNLAAKSLGRLPIPVISMPVRLEEQGKKIRSPAKQEQIERLYGIPASAQDERTLLLCIREQTSFDLDKKIWDSGLGLSSWLTNALLFEPEANIFTHNLKAALAAHETINGLRILELGAGTGIVSICISALLEILQNAQNARVLATDLPSAIELIEHNIATNKEAFPSLSLEASALDWDEDTLPQLAQGPFDLLVMADVTYNTASFPALVQMLDTLIKSSQTSVGGRTPMVIVAYKQRDPAERELWPMLSEIGVHLSLVDSVRGVGAEPVEIWFWIKSLDMNSLAK